MNLYKNTYASIFEAMAVTAADDEGKTGNISLLICSSVTAGGLGYFSGLVMWLLRLRMYSSKEEDDDADIEMMLLLSWFNFQFIFLESGGKTLEDH